MFAVKLSVCVKSSPIFPDFCDKYSHLPGRSNRVFSRKSSVEGDLDRALKNPVSERQECVNIVVFTAISSESQDLFPTPEIAELIDSSLYCHQLRVSGSIPNSRNR